MSDNPQGPTGNQPPQFGGNADQGAPQHQGGSQPYAQQGGAPQYQGGNQPYGQPQGGAPQYQGGNQPYGQQQGYGQPQYQGNDYGQHNPLERPKAVKTASVLVFIAGGLTLLGALFALLGGIAASASSEVADAVEGTTSPGLLIGVGIVDVVIGLLLIFAGVAVRKGKNWGRIATLVMAIVLAVIFIISMIGGSFSGLVPLVLVIIATVQLWKGQAAAWFNALQNNPQER